MRLREKGGKSHALPCHYTLEDYLVAYLDRAGLRSDPKEPLFRMLDRRGEAVTLDEVEGIRI